jgi:hypothetical protein
MLGCCVVLNAVALQIRMDLKHLKTKRQKAQQKHKNESEQLAVSSHVNSVTTMLAS